MKYFPKNDDENISCLSQNTGGQVDGKSLDSGLMISEENNRSVVDDKQKTKCDSFEGRQHLYVATGSNRYGHTQIHNSDQ